MSFEVDRAQRRFGERLGRPSSEVNAAADKSRRDKDLEQRPKVAERQYASAGFTQFAVVAASWALNSPDVQNRCFWHH